MRWKFEYLRFWMGRMDLEAGEIWPGRSENEQGLGAHWTQRNPYPTPLLIIHCTPDSQRQNTDRILRSKFREHFSLFWRSSWQQEQFSEWSSDLTERRPLIKRTPKMAVSVFKPKLTRRGGLRTSGVLRRTSMGPSILQYFGIFHGSFFPLDQETQ